MHSWPLNRCSFKKEKARERQLSGLNNQDVVVENFPQREGKTRDIVADKTGFGSGKQYEKAKFIAENADEEWTTQND